MRFLAAAAAAALAFATLPAQASTYFAVQTGMSGGQTGIDAVSTSAWTFTTGTGGWSFGGGYFEMKEGSGTVADITLSVYQGSNASGTLLDAKTLTNTEFCAAGSVANCQSFDVIPFLFPAAVAMAPGTTYYVALTSPAGTSGSQQYFIKGQTSTLTFRSPTCLFEDNCPTLNDGTTVNTSVPPPPGEPTGVPEPMSLALLGVGLAGLVAARRRRQPLAA